MDIPLVLLGWCLASGLKYVVLPFFFYPLSSCRLGLPVTQMASFVGERVVCLHLVLDKEIWPCCFLPYPLLSDNAVGLLWELPGLAMKIHMGSLIHDHARDVTTLVND